MLIHFVSDIHLRNAAPNIANRFFNYLATVAQQATALYILGDLFDAWVGDDDLNDKFNASVCSALKAVSDGGVALHIMHGNRDFLLGPAFAKASGASMLEDEAVIIINGKPTLLMHGDTLCSDDTDYQEFRSKMRNPDWQRQFLNRPLSERKAEAASLRAISAQAKGGKDAYLMDIHQQTMLAACRRHNVEALIHGHTHRPAIHQHGNITRYVLPEWSADSGAPLVL